MATLIKIVCQNIKRTHDQRFLLAVSGCACTCAKTSAHKEKMCTYKILE